MAYLYRHIRLDNNQIFYIGIGEDQMVSPNSFSRAYSKHSRNNYWKNVTNVTPYEVEIILEDLTWEEACIKEIEFITLYGRKDLGKGLLVNMTGGGDGLYNPSKETRIKKSNSLSQFFKDNPNMSSNIILKRNIFYLDNPEVLENLTKKRLNTFKSNPQIQIDRVNKMDWESIGNKISNNKDRGHKITQSLNKPIIQYNLLGDFIKEYSSIKEASEINSFNKGAICNNLKGKSKTAYGYKWGYKNL